MQPNDVRILLVEDDVLLRQAFALLLEDAGYLCEQAGTAKQAAEALERKLPDLVLLDLGLPDRPGLDLVRDLRLSDRTRGIPIVALTGRAGADERRHCLDAGCTNYFAKPLQPKELLRRLPDLLRGGVKSGA